MLEGRQTRSFVLGLFVLRPNFNLSSDFRLSSQFSVLRPPNLDLCPPTSVRPHLRPPGLSTRSSVALKAESTQANPPKSPTGNPAGALGLAWSFRPKILGTRAPDLSGRGSGQQRSGYLNLSLSTANSLRCPVCVCHFSSAVRWTCLRMTLDPAPLGHPSTETW